MKPNFVLPASYPNHRPAGPLRQGKRPDHRDAWVQARRKAFMTVSFRAMFGEEALDAMVEVEHLLDGFGRGSPDASQERFSEVAKLMEDLKTNPIISDLRAIGLEALCALILQSQGYEALELGRVVPWNETSRDIDVFAIRGDTELRVVECKAYHRRKSILDSDVRKFFTGTVPALKRWLRATERPFRTCTAEIWTTGPKGKEAEKALAELSRPTTDTWNLRRRLAKIEFHTKQRQLGRMGDAVRERFGGVLMGVTPMVARDFPAVGVDL